MNEENQSLDRINKWIRNSVSLKLGTIGILILLLLIPTSMIKSIIAEREVMNFEAVNEVSSKWANAQTISGPILKVPIVYEFENKVKIDGTDRYELVKIERIDHMTILPEQLTINGTVEPRKLRRGIYEIVVYESQLNITGTFDLSWNPDPSGLKEIKWDEAILTVGISDLRGIQNEVDFGIDKTRFPVLPGSGMKSLINSGVTIKPDNLDGKDTIDFDFTLDLQGSSNLSFIPTGGTTEVSINSSWKSPSFNGNFLPDQREVSDEGFSANWKVLQLNRNFPQSWSGPDQPYANEISMAGFGVDLILPLDDYQKSMRSAKYGVMTIFLTFLIFFLVEILNKKRIHPFQYILVGLSLCLFYVLLVSISEHSNFNLAYAVSTLSVVSMISLYSMSILKIKKIAMTMVVVLAGVYGFLFVTLQLADYALLLGSVGLLLILALTMYLTRNINWYKLNVKAE